jgi:hypothetical protein
MPSNEILSALLPQGILEYFELMNLEKKEKEYHFYLEERNVVPVEFSSDKLVSKGFFDEITVQDFPLRGKASYLHIKRRRWENKNTGDIVHRNWNMVAQGTRMTQEFAVFLKGIARQQAGKR